MAFTPEKFIETAVKELKETVGVKDIIIALSGGVDSSVAAILAHKAVGRHLTCFFVDTGFMRLDEPKEVEQIFAKQHGLNLRIIDAKKRFFSGLKGVIDPEKKRKVIGELFIRIFEEEAKKSGATFLLQGTIYPDRIESEGNIKSHHNVGGLPEEFGLKLIEPLKDLYKDEVREVGRYLSLPKEITERMPFPGPGLAVRIIGECTPERAQTIQKVNAIVEEEILNAGILPWQAFACLLGSKSVGVTGDVRSYKETVAIRVVESRDGMTANFSDLSYELLRKISTRITSEVREVGRILYDITNKPPGTIEYE
jgi:GMP synthase (glutamine-hydrolysing)